MMPPGAYRDARVRAAHHIQAEILQCWGGTLSVKVRRVFRGPLKRGARLMLNVSVPPEGPMPIGGTLYWDAASVARAKFLEAFLDGDPPDITWDQVKFLPRITWWPVGDHRRESPGW